MGDKSSERKAAYLGMPYGTAMNRLRKAILFRYVLECGDDLCFRCGTPIDNIDHLSIEHMLPWEQVDQELFWSLDNIAFSHLNCNSSAHRNGNIINRIDSPEGMSWCNRCSSHKPLEDFSPQPKRWNGAYTFCKDCCAVRERKRKLTRKQAKLSC